MSNELPKLTKTGLLGFVRKFGETKDSPSNRTAYYANVFDRHGERGSFFASWNWAATFFGPMWMFYRGMYLFGAIFYVLLMLCTWLSFTAVLQSSQGTMIPWGLILFVIQGVFGNAIYFYYIRMKMSQGVKQGGTHPGAVVFYIFVIWTITGGLGGYIFWGEIQNKFSNQIMETTATTTHISHGDDGNVMTHTKEVTTTYGAPIAQQGMLGEGHDGDK